MPIPDHPIEQADRDILALSNKFTNWDVNARQAEATMLIATELRRIRALLEIMILDKDSAKPK